MSDLSLKSRVINGTFWALLEKFFGQFSSFFITLILARILTPQDYGMVAMLVIFTEVARIAVGGGLSQALIQKKEISEIDKNSVFYAGLGLSILAYAILFLLSPYIAGYYGIIELKLLLRVTSLTIIIQALNLIQDVELNRSLAFNLSFRISLLSSLASAVLGISMALLGFGPWALATQIVGSAVVGMVARIVVVAWKPRLMFSLSSLKALYKFGWKMMVSGLLGTFYANMYGLIIGKIYTPSDLAYVNRGRLMPSYAMNAINETLGRVAFPALAQLQDSKGLFLEAVRKMIKISTFFVFPILCFVAICTPELIYVVLGDQWLASTPYMRLACFTFLLWPFHTINLQAMTARGRSDLFLILEIIKDLLGIILILLTMRHGLLLMMSVVAFVAGPLGVFINVYPNSRQLGYTLRRQLWDVMPTMIACLIASIPCLLLRGIFPANIGLIRCALFIVINSIIGMVVFISVSALFKISPYVEILKIFKPIVEKRLPYVAVLWRFYRNMLFSVGLRFKGIGYRFKYHKELERERSIQNKYSLASLRKAKSVAILLIFGKKNINGGIISIFNFAKTTRRLLPDWEVLVSTAPGNVEIYSENRLFANRERVWRWDLVMNNLDSAENLVIHIPECNVKSFLIHLPRKDGIRLASVKNLRINIMNQQTLLMPSQKIVNKLRKLTKNISQTTAHIKYTSQELCDKFGTPILRLGTYHSLAAYRRYDWSEKDKVIVYSPDVHPLRQTILNVLKEELPEYRLIEVNNLTFDAYMDLISRAFCVLTFGEGFDGYYSQPILIGSLSFSVYNDFFFPANVKWKDLYTIFSSYEEMCEKIVERISLAASSRTTYENAVASTFAALQINATSQSDYEDRVMRFYAGMFDLYPSEGN